jgi:hypothetical protein
MSQVISNDDKLIKDLLTTLVSLRVYTIHVTFPFHDIMAENYLPYITKTSDRAPHLEYFALSEGKDYYAKRVCGKWVSCDEAEFPSHKLEF